MDNKKLLNVIEALLFSTDKPLPANVIAEVVELPVEKIQEAMGELDIKLKESNSSVKLMQIAGGYQLVTYPEYAPYIKKLYKNKLLTRLSKPAMEVLAVIAYKQPITKQEVEAIRGINSDGVYHTLLERKLIKIVGRKDAPGRPLLYGTTKEFLQYLGINSLDDLPKIEEVKAILEKEENAVNWQERIDEAKKQQISLFDEEGRPIQVENEQQKNDDAGKNNMETEEYDEAEGKNNEDDLEKEDEEEDKEEYEDEDENEEEDEEEEWEEDEDEEDEEDEEEEAEEEEDKEDEENEEEEDDEDEWEEDEEDEDEEDDEAEEDDDMSGTKEK